MSTQHEDRSRYAALLLRICLGSLFLAHVALKYFVFTVPGFVAFMGSLGLPAIAAYGVIAVELLGGVAILVGLWTSQVATLLAVELLGAIVLVHGAKGWMFTNPGGGWEFLALWIVALLALSLLGDGAYALSPALRHRR